jgi:hypothetical protein
VGEDDLAAARLHRIYLQLPSLALARQVALLRTPYIFDLRGYGWMPHNAGFGFLDLAPSILHSNWFWDYIS